MATVLDFAVFENFKVLIAFVLLAVMFFGVLPKTKLLGESKVVYALVAILVAVIFAMNATTVEILFRIFPWFTVFALVISVILIAFSLFGSDQDHAFSVIKTNPTLVWSVIIIGVIIITVAIGSVVGNEVMNKVQNDTSQYDSEASPHSTNTGDAWTNFLKTIFHPKVLGLILILVIGAATVRLLASK